MCLWVRWETANSNSSGSTTKLSTQLETRSQAINMIWLFWLDSSRASWRDLPWWALKAWVFCFRVSSEQSLPVNPLDSTAVYLFQDFQSRVEVPCKVIIIPNTSPPLILIIMVTVLRIWGKHLRFTNGQGMLNLEPVDFVEVLLNWKHSCITPRKILSQSHKSYNQQFSLQAQCSDYNHL